MNRFRTKKKAKDDAASVPRASHESESSTPFRLFGKGKKSQEEEPKKELDLENALPPSDDFRTSLLMTGLSARFSMLREQDDPNTKIGKASDDSVLFPNRQSRLMDFGFGPGANALSDIAEVESIRKEAPFNRMDSYHSADGSSISGSVMDRAKPGEGNNLFGGRQKVYKLASGTASTKNLEGGGMSGRVLYDDDVSKSAFQKWRQAEKSKMSFDDEHDQTQSSLDLARAESPPPVGYNSKRETNSTTSSTPSVGRNSTAATSVMSQPTSAAKDWQSSSTAPNSAAGTPHLERTYTRTRRLYETGLNHELQEQQSSALSRMDTLSRQRTLGSRTPDLTQNGPSPTSSLFNDRFGERRILAKASAPNLRSGSPLTAGSPIPPMDLGVTNPEPSPSFGGAPPLSPPISEGEENSILPSDRGKATAMGLFQKPLHSYDESRYAQRQLQLQQGRDTPANRFRAESNASQTTGRSRSSSSAHRLPIEKPEPTIRTEPTVKEEEAGMSFYDDSMSLQDEYTRPASVFHLASRRPADRDHPALRNSAEPAPLSSTMTRVSAEPSPTPQQPFPPVSAMSVESPDSPQDSPTLPSSSGLSGMVRQHLRTDSATSSLYGSAPQTSNFASRFPLDPYDSKSMADMGAMANPWEAQSPDWRFSTLNGNEQADSEHKEQQPAPQPRPALPSGTRNASERNTASSTEMEKDQDEFASQLADGARRVRERLTSYVESDRDSRSLSPNPVDRIREPSLPRPNPLGILRQKTSRGSLIDRNRENRQDSQHSKAIKMLGLASSTISSAPSPSRSSFEDKEPPSPVREDREKPSFPRAETTPVLPSQETSKDKEEEPVHAGLRAFRQARKQLLESQKSPSTVPMVPGPMPGSVATPMVGPPASRTAPSRERTPSQRSASRERRPPPITYQQRAPTEEPQSSNGPGRAASRPPSRTERDRSGSEASNGERCHRPARLRTGTASSPHEDRGMGLNPPQGPHSGRPAMLQSPGLPGTNIRRSPIMPPQPYPTGAPSAKTLDRSASSGNLAVQYRRRGPDPAQPSLISPMAPIPSPSIPVSQSTPSFVPSRRPSAPPVPSPNYENPAASRLDEPMKRTVRKRDISEPTFVSSTSRVPTVALPETSESRSRSGLRSRSGSMLGGAASTPNLHAIMQAHANAPPVPPINPKRRNMIGSMMGRRGEDDSGASSPHPTFSPPPVLGERGGDSHSAFSVSDEEDGSGSQRRRLRKTISEANGMNMRARLARGNSPPNMPAPTAMTGGLNNGSMPGGMI
ncbi:hypothetical protein CSHISOI_08459 [Colletotrichum shisoi]|uniref:Uncharacterized protein n=1 Tax=Colletotrichum shisoi TaxID=2078593 RepID=A0A5Q4BK16_9PEZI|nr:hypothetical protein CSHISOI_08459 [Colletotrichum shisoi]